MVEHVIGFTALAGFAFALLLFLSRWFYWVTPRSAAYVPVNWTFFWTLALSFLLGDVFLVLQSVPLMHGWGSWKWVLSAVATLVALGFEAVVFLTLCVGMSFIGK